jgi:hypothetical protein
MGDDFRRDIHADDMRRNSRQQIRAIALAAGDVKDVLALRQLPRDEVAMNVFQPNVALDLRHVPLAGPLNQVPIRLITVHWVPLSSPARRQG